MTVQQLKPLAQYMRLEPVEFDTTRRYPDCIKQIIAAAQTGNDVFGAVDATIKVLGFDTFMYCCAAVPRPHSESRIWTFTTLPVEWVKEYLENDYIEVDPRLQGLFRSPLPVIWDQNDKDNDPLLRKFLERASRYGIRSGIALMIPDNDDFSCAMCFNSSIAVADEFRRSRWTSQEGELMTFALYFHTLFMKPQIRRGLAPLLQGAPLSPRELETLRLVVRGLTHQQIAEQMRISPRTVQLHADSIRSKLNANTISEAVFLATKAGLLANVPTVTSSAAG